MGFENLDMVEYYHEMVEDTKKMIKEELNKDNPDEERLKMLARRYRTTTSAYNLNKALRENGKGSKK